MKMFKRISISALSVVAAATIALGGISPVANAASNKVVVAGSTALLPITQQAAKEFKKSNPKVSISVSGSSSIAGPQSVTKGSATIGAIDWDPTKAVPGFKAFKGLVAYKVSATPFATIVNKSNKVSNLTTKQLQGIFAGTITNWKQVGGNDAAIVVVNRKFGSGTRVNFQMKALQGKSFMSSGAHYIEVGKSGEMVTSVDSNPNAIGYVDLPYVKGGIKALKYNGVAATTANVMNGKYKVWGFGYLVTKGKATGANLKYIKYIQSSKFQNSVLPKFKLVPITKIK